LLTPSQQRCYPFSPGRINTTQRSKYKRDNSCKTPLGNTLPYMPVPPPLVHLTLFYTFHKPSLSVFAYCMHRTEAEKDKEGEGQGRRRARRAKNL